MGTTPETLKILLKQRKETEEYIEQYQLWVDIGIQELTDINYRIREIENENGI